MSNVIIIIMNDWNGRPPWAERVYRRNQDRNARSSIREGAMIESWASRSMAPVASAKRERTSASTP
jgi:hypothetical protein